ncbi:DNA topoisomerase 4 subunit A [Patescibacteria group bacterium]|nr:DNA topoisomerase 4 subunit A [Patescibacteria group bacterium]
MAKAKNNNQQEEQKNNIGKIEAREITQEMRSSYIDYAMSVIVARALPDVRDGLKPVHRRILYAMHEDGLTHAAKYRKSATVIGSTLGRYHPHGDTAVYDSLVRMAQDFSLRYPLIDGQGNFGSIDGDPAAAMRYSEVRMSRVGEEMLRDIEKDTVDFVDNYDGTRREPTVLPSPVPQLLLNGTLGIAVGMATNIPPHNFSEVVDALFHVLEKPKASTEDVFQFIKGPDFPTGGTIYNKREIIEAYTQGRGPIVMRGKADVIEGDDKNRPQIVITEIPYQVNKATLVEQFAKLVADKKIDGIRDIRDESDKDGMRIVFDLARDAYPQKILNRLYKFSDLQRTFHLNMLALVDSIQPKTLSLTEVLLHFLEHRRQVIYRRMKYDFNRAKEREHILLGLYKCLVNIDKVIKIIRGSNDRDDAKTKLMKQFHLSEIQANAILDMRLAQLAKLERKRIEDELKEIKVKIKELAAILASPKKIDGVVKKELAAAKETFGDERKTKVQIAPLGKSVNSSFEDIGCIGLKLHSNDNLHIVQFNKGAFIFSRLKPYANWEQFSQEALRLWAIYCELLKPSEVRRIGLRFINRISIKQPNVRSSPTFYKESLLYHKELIIHR